MQSGSRHDPGSATDLRGDRPRDRRAPRRDRGPVVGTLARARGRSTRAAGGAVQRDSRLPPSHRAAGPLGRFAERRGRRDLGRGGARACRDARAPGVRRLGRAQGVHPSSFRARRARARARADGRGAVRGAHAGDRGRDGAHRRQLRRGSRRRGAATGGRARRLRDARAAQSAEHGASSRRAAPRAGAGDGIRLAPRSSAWLGPTTSSSS